MHITRVHWAEIGEKREVVPLLTLLLAEKSAPRKNPSIAIKKAELAVKAIQGFNEGREVIYDSK